MILKEVKQRMSSNKAKPDTGGAWECHQLMLPIFQNAGVFCLLKRNLSAVAYINRSNMWLCLVWWLYPIFTALLSHTTIQNIECEMSARLTTPFPVKCEHFLFMMDVFIVWQMTLTTDGDYTSSLFSFSSVAFSKANTEQLTGTQLQKDSTMPKSQKL